MRRLQELRLAVAGAAEDVGVLKPDAEGNGEGRRRAEKVHKRRRAKVHFHELEGRSRLRFRGHHQRLPRGICRVDLRGKEQIIPHYILQAAERARERGADDPVHHRRGVVEPLQNRN